MATETFGDQGVLLDSAELGSDDPLRAGTKVRPVTAAEERDNNKESPCESIHDAQQIVDEWI